MLSTQARVLIVDDDLPVRSAVAVALRSAGYETAALADGSGLLHTVEQFRPDLAVLDVRLPHGPDGYAMARSLRDRSSLPILFLTAVDEVEDRLASFRAGADDHLAKPFAMAELLARVQALLRRSGRPSSQCWQVADLVVDDAAHTVVRAGRPVDLTRTEYDLLLVLLQHAGRVLTKAQLLTLVWGFGDYDANLVEVHMVALRRKLEAAGPRLVQTVRGAGYVVRP